MRRRVERGGGRCQEIVGWLGVLVADWVLVVVLGERVRKGFCRDSWGFLGG